MDRLSYGLNMKQPKTLQGSGIKRKVNLASAFAGTDSESEHDDAPGFQRPKPKQSSILEAKAIAVTPEDPLQLDASIYDYDGAWEDIKTVERGKKAALEEDAAQRKPKYMGNLLAAAEVRKRDQLRAKERLLQKERENEGDEFRDKEKFVTTAYKEQQLEMQKLEEEEQQREAATAKSSKGMSTFYRNILDRAERDHADAVSATLNPKRSSMIKTDVSADILEEKSTNNEASEINRRMPGAIQTNDEGEVVDKRQLLSAGLNVAPKARENTQRLQGLKIQQTQGHNRGGSSQRAGIRERQSRLIADQLEATQKRNQEAETKATTELERQAKLRRTTDGDVQSARERYFQRKREAESKA